MEISDAIWQYVFPRLDLQDIMQLASTCTASHYLIAHTPLDHLSASVSQAVVPPGLTSKRCLLELVSKRGELLTHLRGRGSFSPQIQHLSFSDDVADGCLQGNAQHKPSPSGPLLRIEQVLWSPSMIFEEPSRWLLLNPESGSQRAPIVLDTKTGQQVSFHGRRCSSVLDPPLPGHGTQLHASWLSDGHRLLWHPAQEHWWCRRPCSPKEICLVDACSQKLSPVILPGAQHAGNSHFFTACSLDDQARPLARDIIAWVASPVVNRRLEDHVIVFDVSGRQTLFQLACPENVFHTFLQRHGLPISPGQQGDPQEAGKDWDIDACDLQLSPNKRLLAITWLCQRRDGQAYSDSNSKVMGLSIHNAISGACQHSMVLTTTWQGPIRQPEWLPCSSNLMYANSNSLHLITSAGQLLWHSSLADRCPRLASALPAQPNADWTITPSASPCGHWLLVTDELKHDPQLANFNHGPADFREQEPTFDGHISLVEASTGRILYDHRSTRRCHSCIKWMRLETCASIQGCQESSPSSL